LGCIDPDDPQQVCHLAVEILTPLVTAAMPRLPNAALGGSIEKTALPSASA
jgi:hypothetical protein